VVAPKNVAIPAKAAVLMANNDFFIVFSFRFMEARG
jgi:hypothetical protein